MKHRISVLLLSTAMLIGSACTAPSDQSIIVANARFPGTECDFSNASLYVESGALDLSVLPIYQSYYQAFSWENDLEDISVTVTSQITSETPNTFIASTINDSYNLVGGASPPSGLVSISAAIQPGGTFENNYVGVYLLTAEAVTSICGPPLLDGTDNCPNFDASKQQTLLVTFTLSGALVGGSAAATNAVTFPIYLFKGGHVAPNGSCDTGYVAQTTSCGVPGRDIPYCVPE